MKSAFKGPLRSVISHAELVMLEVRAELLELAMIARLLEGGSALSRTRLPAGMTDSNPFH